MFVAILVPDDFKNNLRKFIEINSEIANIRWTPEPNWHLTLFFIGFINEIKLPVVNRKLQNLISGKKSFLLNFEMYSLEGKPSKSSMIWCRFQYSDLFANLSGEIEKELKNELEHIQDFKRTIPHITLARLRRSVKRKEINLKVQSEIKEIKVDKCQLWQSIGTTSGMIYDNLFEYNLND